MPRKRARKLDTEGKAGSPLQATDDLTKGQDNGGVFAGAVREISASSPTKDVETYHEGETDLLGTKNSPPPVECDIIGQNGKNFEDLKEADFSLGNVSEEFKIGALEAALEVVSHPAKLATSSFPLAEKDSSFYESGGDHIDFPRSQLSVSSIRNSLVEISHESREASLPSMYSECKDGAQVDKEGLNEELEPQSGLSTVLIHGKTEELHIQMGSTGVSDYSTSGNIEQDNPFKEFSSEYSKAMGDQVNGLSSSPAFQTSGDFVAPTFLESVKTGSISGEHTQNVFISDDNERGIGGMEGFEYGASEETIPSCSAHMPSDFASNDSVSVDVGEQFSQNAEKFLVDDSSTPDLNAANTDVIPGGDDDNRFSVVTTGSVNREEALVETEVNECLIPDNRLKVARFVCMNAMDSTLNAICQTDLGFNEYQGTVVDYTNVQKYNVPLHSFPSHPSFTANAEEDVNHSLAASMGENVLADVPSDFNPHEGYDSKPPILGSQIISSVSSGGLQYLLTAARSNCGIASGRYAYEVRLLDFQPNIPYVRERLRDTDLATSRGVTTVGIDTHPQFVRGHVRVGVCTMDDTLFLGDSPSSWGYDSDGNVHNNSQCYKPKSSKRMERYDVITVLVSMTEDIGDGEVSSKNASVTPADKNESEKSSVLMPPNSVNSTLNSKTVDSNIDNSSSNDFTCVENFQETSSDLLNNEEGESQEKGKSEVDSFQNMDSFIAVNSDKAAHDSVGDDTLENTSGKRYRRMNCTLSIFRNGHRVCASQKISWEVLKGRSLFPCVTFRGACLLVNFGALGLQKHLPFTVKLLQEAAEEDVEWSTLVRPADNKFEVIFPVGVPNEGTFDWIDDFHSRFPHKYLELSDRMLISWGIKSGLQRVSQFRRRGRDFDDCADKPLFNFGNYLLDEAANLRKTVRLLACVRQRNYIVMELKKNLISADRKELLSDFNATWFKKIAYVVMGEPPEYFKRKQYDLYLKSLANDDLQYSSSVTSDFFGSNKVEISSNTPSEQLQQSYNKNFWFRKREQEDLSAKTIASCFTNFSIPNISEGFSHIHYEWDGLSKCEQYLTNWIRMHKITIVMYNHRPSGVFQKKLEEWNKLKAKWIAATEEYKKSNTNLEDVKLTQDIEKIKSLFLKLSEPMKEAMEEPSKPDTIENEDETVVSTGNVESTSETPACTTDKQIDVSTLPKPSGEIEKKLEEEIERISNLYDEELKIFREEAEIHEHAEVDEESGTITATSEDKKSIPMKLDESGKEIPIFVHFKAEDWKLLDARVEVFLLINAFKQDVKDADRQSIYVEHFPYYFRLYFDRQFRYDDYPSCSKMSELLGLLNDTVKLSAPPSVLLSILKEDTSWDIFSKLTERVRRVRGLRVAVRMAEPLKLSKPHEVSTAPRREREGKIADKPHVAPVRFPRDSIMRCLGKEAGLSYSGGTAVGSTAMGGMSRRALGYGMGTDISNRPLNKLDYRENSGSWKATNQMYNKSRDHVESYRNRFREVPDMRMWDHRGTTKGASSLDVYKRIRNQSVDERSDTRDDFRVGKLPPISGGGGHSSGSESKRNGVSRNANADRGRGSRFHEENRSGISKRVWDNHYDINTSHDVRSSTGTTRGMNETTKGSRFDDASHGRGSSNYEVPSTSSSKRQYDLFLSTPSDPPKRSRNDDYDMQAAVPQAVDLHFGGHHSQMSTYSSQQQQQLKHGQVTQSQVVRSSNKSAYLSDPYAQSSPLIGSVNQQNLKQSSPQGSATGANISSNLSAQAQGYYRNSSSGASSTSSGGGGNIRGGVTYNQSFQRLYNQQEGDNTAYANYSFSGGAGGGIGNPSSISTAGGINSYGGNYSTLTGHQTAVGQMMQQAQYQSPQQYNSQAYTQRQQLQTMYTAGAGGNVAGGGYYSSSYNVGAKGSR